MKTFKNDKVSLCLAMAIFGTVGIFSKLMPFSSSLIALARAVIGLAFLIALMLLAKKKPSLPLLKKHLAALLISGALLGVNWALFFEACKRTTVASATLAYYFAPVIMTVLGVIFFKEKIGAKRVICISLSVLGMALVSGVFGASEGVTAVGILLGLLAALLYAVIVILNKTLGEIPAFEKTAFQFAVSAVVLLPYTVFTGGLSTEGAEPLAFIMLAVVGILHTGIAYALYFGATPGLHAGEIALMSYIDPIVALFVSAALGEGLSGFGILGAVLIFLSSVIADIPTKRIKKSKDRKPDAAHTDKSECEDENR